MKFYATFGSNHRCVKNNVVITGRSCVELEARNEAAARERMFDVFGPRWAMIYKTKADAGVDTHGLDLIDYNKLMLVARNG